MFYSAALRDWRERRKYTKTHVSKLLNLSKSHYGDLEKGVYQPSTKVISKILELTGLSPDVFFQINKSKTDPSTMQNLFLKTHQEVLNLRGIIHANYIEIAKINAINYIHEEVIKAVNAAIPQKSKYREEIIEIARDSIQKQNISCEIVCHALNINVLTLKKWIGKDKLLFKCTFGEHKPVYAATPEHAGEIFQCIDCAHLERKYCKGFGFQFGGIGVSNIDNEINVFSIINNLSKKGVTARSDQINILREQYNFETTESTLTEYIRRYNKGEHVPDSFIFMISDKPASTKEAD